jgi:hypothetical protein
MPASDGNGRKNGDNTDGLMAVVEEVSREVKALSARVDELVSAVKALDGAPTAPQDPAPIRRAPKVAGQPAGSRREVKRTAVVVAPLPELAMAAMAETSLRDLPGVSEVVASERVEDSARFTLEVVEGTDVIAEMRNAMPVPFTVVDPGPEEISVRLRWAWGTPD